VAGEKKAQPLEKGKNHKQARLPAKHRKKRTQKNGIGGLEKKLGECKGAG